VGLRVSTKTVLITLYRDICSLYLFQLPTVRRLGAELTIHNSFTLIQKRCYNLMDCRDIKTDSCVSIMGGSLLTTCNSSSRYWCRINQHV